MRIGHRDRGWRGLCGTAVLLQAVACAGPETEEAGDEVPTWSVSAEPILQIGEQDGAEAYLFRSISAVQFLEAGGLAVADPGLHSIRFYDSGGTFRVGMGREGEGPGEFAWLSHLEVRGDTIVAYDPSLFRVTRFMSDGRFLDTKQIESAGGAPELLIGTYSDGNTAFGTISSIGRDRAAATSDMWTLGRYDEDGSRLRTLGQAEGFRRLGGSPVPFSGSLHAFLVDDSIFHTDGRDPSINVLTEDGEVARVIALDIAASNTAEAWNVLRAELESQGQLSMLDRFPAGAEEEPVPRIAEVLLDDLDRFWVKHYAPATDSWLLGGLSQARGGHWSIIRRDASAVASINLPANFIPMAVRGGRIVGVEKDELDVQRVAVYGVQR